MTWPKDDWEIIRNKGDALTETEIGRLFDAWQHGKSPRDIARELRLSSRGARGYFVRFKNGYRPGQPRLHPGSDANFTGPVEKRPMTAPNAMPGITKQQLMGSKAR